MMDTKEIMIQKSFILFLSKGYKEVSVSEIHKECGVSKGAFYHHFVSKDALYKEVLDRFFFSYFKRDDADYSDATVEQKFKDFAKTFIGPYKEISKLLNKKQITAYFRFLFQAANSFDDIRENVNRHFYIKGYYLFQILEQGKQHNEIKEEINSKAIARQMLSTIIGVTILEGIYDISDVQDRFDEIISEYYNLLKK